MRVGAAILAVLLALVGVRSVFKWNRVRFEAGSLRDQLLYSLHVTARTSVWFALAGAFVGFAVLDEPERFQWYVLIPLGLAALQVLAAVALWRSPPPAQREAVPRGSGTKSSPVGNGSIARLLANQARDELRGAGLTDRQIQQLADDYIALDRGEDLQDFIAWALRVAR
jgi:hypothetical protein